VNPLLSNRIPAKKRIPRKELFASLVPFIRIINKGILHQRKHSFKILKIYPMRQGRRAIGTVLSGAIGTVLLHHSNKFMGTVLLHN
jgi:hypothetical protein